MADRDKSTRNISAFLTKQSPFKYRESYKQFRTTLQYTMSENNLKTIVVTSAISGEGKTTLSVNLAEVLADTGAKVLLIDCDLRKPKIAKVLGLNPNVQRGLGDILAGTIQAGNAIHHMKHMRFDVLASHTPPEKPAEVIGSKKMEVLLSALKHYYDYVICDAPPVTVVTDAAVLSQFCDGVILVVRQRAATRNQVIRAMRNLTHVNSNILGVVFNGYDISRDTFIDRHDYDSY